MAKANDEAAVVPAAASPRDAGEPMQRANFGVVKRKHGKLQDRVLQLDYDQQMLFNTAHGAVRKSWAFDQVAEVLTDKENPRLLFLLLKDFRRYELLLDSEDERSILVLLLGEILASQGRRVPSSHCLGPVCKQGWADKRGKHVWDRRWLVLYQTRLIVFKSDIDVYPVNVVLLQGIDVGRQGDAVFTIATQARPYSFRCENRDEREDWIVRIHKAMSEANAVWSM